MNGKKITMVISLCFYFIIFLLTIVAKKIHIASLPKVTVECLEFVTFEREEQAKENSNMLEFGLGLPKTLYDNHEIYVISTEIMNGEERSIARIVTDLVLGRENEDYYEVLEGISNLDQVIVYSDGVIYEGEEVAIEK